MSVLMICAHAMLVPYFGLLLLQVLPMGMSAGKAAYLAIF